MSNSSSRQSSHEASDAAVGDNDTTVKPIRANGHTSKEYRELLNKVIAEATDATSRYEPYTERGPRQIGASIWTHDEHNLFFDALCSVGRHNVRAIASAVGSKSEFEVAEYLIVFSKARYELVSRQSGRPTPIDIAPAAFEIGNDCEAALDRAAEALSRSVERFDRQRERARYGHYAILDETVADEIEAFMCGSGERAGDSATGTGIDEHSIPVKAAELLHLQNWLKVSRLLGCREDKQGHEDSPSMYQTAFNDFHNLAISLTQRLMQAAIFQATSRHRANEEPRRTRLPEVRHQDVYAAAQMLGLKSDWFKFWTGCARRNHLLVRVRKGAMSVNMNYDEVEHALRRETAGVVEDENVLQSVEERADLDWLDDSSDSDFWTDAASDDDDVLDDSDIGAEATTDQEQPPRKRNRDVKSLVRTRHRAEDQYLEALDRQASQNEESKIWEMLRRPGPMEPVIELPRLPAKRSREGDLIDWRDGIEYRAEWESFPVPVEAAAFALVAERGRLAKRRRLEACARRAGEKTHGPETDSEDASMESHGIDDRSSELDPDGEMASEDSSGPKLKPEIRNALMERDLADESSSELDSDEQIASEDTLGLGIKTDSRHESIEQYGNTTSSELDSDEQMASGATLGPGIKSGDSDASMERDVADEHSCELDFGTQMASADTYGSKMVSENRNASVEQDETIEEFGELDSDKDVGYAYQDRDIEL